MSIFYGVNDDGILLKFNGTFWGKFTNQDYLVSSGNSYISKSTYSITGVTSQGLYFNDNYQRSINWYNAKTFCDNQSMRLPFYEESHLAISGGMSAILPDGGVSTLWTPEEASSTEAVAFNQSVRYNSRPKGENNAVRCVK